MTRSDALRNAIANAIGEFLDGGSLNLYTSDRSDAKLLAKIPLADPAFTKARGSKITMREVGMVEPLGRGYPKHFRAFSSAGEEAFSGTAGGPASGAEVVLDREDLDPTAEVKVVKLVYGVG